MVRLKTTYSSIFAEVGNGTVGIGISYVPTSIATPDKRERTSSDN